MPKDLTILSRWGVLVDRVDFLGPAEMDDVLDGKTDCATAPDSEDVVFAHLG